MQKKINTRIYPLLSPGIENATTARRLAECLHVECRDVTIQIERERAAGAPICASSDGINGGYYVARNRQELLSYIGRLTSRRNAINATIRGLMKALDKLPDATWDNHKTQAN